MLPFISSVFLGVVPGCPTLFLPTPRRRDRCFTGKQWSWMAATEKEIPGYHSPAEPLNVQSRWEWWRIYKNGNSFKGPARQKLLTNHEVPPLWVSGVVSSHCKRSPSSPGCLQETISVNCDSKACHLMWLQEEKPALLQCNPSMKKLIKYMSLRKQSYLQGKKRSHMNAWNCWLKSPFHSYVNTSSVNRIVTQREIRLTIFQINKLWLDFITFSFSHSTLAT